MVGRRDTWQVSRRWAKQRLTTDGHPDSDRRRAGASGLAPLPFALALGLPEALDAQVLLSGLSMPKQTIGQIGAKRVVDPMLAQAYTTAAASNRRSWL